MILLKNTINNMLKESNTNLDEATNTISKDIEKNNNKSKGIKKSYIENS